jgi:hypothetical protein
VGIDSFDFDEWATLAESAPNMFEERRRECIEQLIANGRNIHRLRGLQCRIDMERIRARTAMKSCLRIFTLMWDSFLECHKTLDKFVYKTLTPEEDLTLPKQSAQIIYFQRKT